MDAPRHSCQFLGLGDVGLIDLVCKPAHVRPGFHQVILFQGLQRLPQGGAANTQLRYQLAFGGKLAPCARLPSSSEAANFPAAVSANVL